MVAWSSEEGTMGTSLLFLDEGIPTGSAVAGPLSTKPPEPFMMGHSSTPDQTSSA